MKKVYVIAGEPSGDLHGAHLVEAMRMIDPDLRFRGFGGIQMASAGVKLDQTIDQLSFMGFSEVVKHFPVIITNFRKAKQAIQSWNPDAILYIDFPGFNLRMAAWAKKKGYKNFYYIAPQVWAWKERRALKIRKYVDELFCILPFEKEFFARFDYDVHYVGHPLVDIIRQFRQNQKKSFPSDVQVRTLTEKSDTTNEASTVPGKKIIALLPGSRTQEVLKILPAQLEAVKYMTDFRVIIGKSPHVPGQVYTDIMSVTDTHPEITENTYALLGKAYVACVASGTATLETALFQVPEVVSFRGTRFNYWIAKRLIKVPWISLVNLIMGQEVVRELIQEQHTPEQIRSEVLRLMEESHREKIIELYRKLEEKLGAGGAAEKTAKIIILQYGA